MHTIESLGLLSRIVSWLKYIANFGSSQGETSRRGATCQQADVACRVRVELDQRIFDIENGIAASLAEVDAYCSEPCLLIALSLPVLDAEHALYSLE